MITRLLVLFTNNWGLKLVSVIIAVLLWAIILGSQKVEVEKEVALKILTAPNIVPANEIPKKVTFRLSGPKGFLRQVLDQGDIPLEVNLRDSQAGLVTYRFFTDDLRVPLGVKVVSINPAAIFIRLESVATVELPVHVDLVGRPPEGYQIKKVEVDPPQVRIRGAESRVKKLRQIATKPFDLGQLTENFESLADLDLEKNHLELEQDPPRLLIEVDTVMTSFKIKNIPVRVHTAHRVRVAEPSITVFVKTTPSDLKAIDQNSLFAEVDLRGKPKGKYLERMNIELPKKVHILRTIPERVDITLY